MPTLDHLRGGNMPHPILNTQLFSLNQKATENLMSLSPQVYQNTHLVGIGNHLISDVVL